MFPTTTPTDNVLLIILHLQNTVLLMFIECWGHTSALYLWSFVMLFVYRCKREYYLSEFKVLFIIYGKLTVPETKRIVNNLKRQLSRGDFSYSLSIGANIIVLNQFDQLCSSWSCFSSLFFLQFLNIYLSHCVPRGTALQKYPIF